MPREEQMDELYDQADEGLQLDTLTARMMHALFVTNVLPNIVPTEDGESNTTSLVRLQNIVVAQMEMEPSAQQKIGFVYSAQNYQVPSSINISEMLMKIICDGGCKGRDLSEELNPNMTVLEINQWKLRLYESIHKNPDTIFFVTCDAITPIEGIMYLDDALKRHALVGFVKYQGDAQAFAWRGEDYVRIAGLHGFPRPLLSLTQQMKTLTEPDQECSICFEVINDDQSIDAIVNGRTQFTCMHTICRKCYEDTTLDCCPVCRCTDSLHMAMNKTLKPKNKKKTRAAARRNR
jgi:hypothetical protein